MPLFLIRVERFGCKPRSCQRCIETHIGLFPVLQIVFSKQNFQQIFGTGLAFNYLESQQTCHLKGKVASVLKQATDAGGKPWQSKYVKPWLVWYVMVWYAMVW